MDADDPILGSTIGERYRIVAPLGRGGMGAVYRAEHLMMKKELALKLLHPELGRLDEVARRFEREAEAAARLSHVNIINVTDFGRTAEGSLFLVMELLQGPLLSEVIAAGDGDGKPMSPERAVHILKQILRALEHAHAAGIVHRDLKPDNIVLVEREGEKDIVKLLDFGIARIMDDAKESITQAGVVFGTPEYLSPEQAMGEDADGRADLYAAGVILFEMLSGRRPFDGDSRVEVVSMHLTRPIPPLPPGLPPILGECVQRAMAKKRDERFASAAEFLRALDEPATVVDVPRRISRRLWIPALALLGLLVAVLGVWRLSHSPASAEGRAHFALGNDAVLAGDRARALDEYRRALQLDSHYRNNAVLRANVSAMLDSRSDGAAALQLLVGSVGKPALPEVVACAKLCRDDKIRRRAAEAAALLGGPAFAAADFKAPVDLSSAVEKLRNGRGCRERKAAALLLIDSGDRRYLDNLRSARDRTGGFLGVEEVNGCMRRELDAAIHKLESK